MIDLSALAGQLRGKGSPLTLAPGDTTLPAELHTFLASVPGGSLTLAVAADGIRLDGQTLTITGTASDTWPVQGYANVTVTLMAATVTIVNAGGVSSVTGLATGSLPVGGHSVTAALASAMIQSVQAWTLTLGGPASGLRASDLLMLGQSARFTGPTVPAGLDALDTAVTVEPAGLVLTFFPGTTFDPWLSVALEVPGARWTVIEQILEFDGIEIAMFLAPRSYSVALTSYLVIDKISVAVTVGMSADSHWIASVRPKTGTVFPGLVALAEWLCGAASGVPGQATGGFQASGFDLATFDVAISSVRAGFDVSRGSLDFVEVTSVLKIEALQLDVAVRLPDLTIQGGLHGGEPLNVAAVLASFGLATDAVPATLTVSEADFSAQPRRGTFAVDLILDDLWEAGPLAFEQVAVSVSRDSTGQFTGWIYCFLTIGASTRLTMSAGYEGPQTGWSFAGGTLGDDGLPVGELLAMLSAKFGIGDVPEALTSLTLKNLMLAYQTGTGAFTFTCEGDFTIAQTPVSLAIDVHITDSTGTGYSAEFHGRLSVGDLVFDVVFDTEPGGQTFVASYRNDGAAASVSLHDLVASLSPAAAAGVPPDLSIGLTDAKFAYVKPAGAAEGAFALGLDLSAKTSLSELPLIGPELPPDASVAINNLQIIYSQATIDGSGMAVANNLLAAMGVIPFPATLAGGVAFTADLQAGTDHLTISLGVPEAPAQKAIAERLAAAPAPVSQPVGHWFDVSKSLGPVSISRIGVQYQDSALFLLIDASLGLAALTVGLDGLGLGSPLGRFELRPHLDGLSISFSDGPISIAGGFLVVATPPPGVTDEYAGELTIAFEPYLISGFGAYAKVSGSPSFFVFAEVDGEFGGPPAFFVTGLMGGVGYNWALSLPPPDQVYQFPFVAGLGNPSFFGGTKPTPVQVLEVLSGGGGTTTAWVTPAAGQNWLAAGVQFRSFELITGRALLVAEFGTEFELALLGLATVALPQGATDDAYAYAELQLEVVLKPDDGVFSAIASLTPSSYLLTKQCHLTGGFAFCLWFGPSPHSGDFVLTLGGYHPAFTPKPWYPSVPRLGFHWAVDDSLVIKGGAYFAITPTAVMAGASLEVLFESGNLRAWLIAYANIMIRWRPFYLTAEIGISIGVSYRLNLEFTSVVLAVQLGATLELWGPPTGGVVHIDWYILSFSIAFGAPRASAGDLTLDWPGFQELLPSASTPAGARVAGARAAAVPAPSAGDSHPAIVSLTVSRGLRSTDSATGDWIVRADELVLTTASAIPVTSVIFGKQVPLPAGAPATIDIRPMGATGVTSALTVTIFGVDLTTWPVPSVQSAAQPEALWGSPIPDSAAPAPAANLVPGLVTGVTFAPPPAIAGAAAGPVDPDSLISPLGFGELPLRPASQGDPIAEPVADPGTILAIASGVASPASVRAQQALVSVLAGYQAGPPTSAPLTGLGNEAGAVFSQPPMRTA